MTIQIRRPSELPEDQRPWEDIHRMVGNDHAAAWDWIDRHRQDYPLGTLFGVLGESQRREG